MSRRKHHALILLFRRMAEHLDDCLPNLETLVLTNNNIQELGDLDVLSSFQNLTSMS